MFGKRALQTRHNEVLKDYQDTTNKLGEAIGELEKANRRIALLEKQVIDSLSRQVAMLDFLQEVMIFVQDAPILVRNGKSWQGKRDSLVARAKAQNWYREPGEQEAEQVTE